MSENVFKFVDSISAGAATLLDLDNGDPFWVVEGTQTPAPERRESVSYNNMRDGSIDAAAPFGDRVVTLVLDLNPEVAAEQQLSAIQKLGRLLNSEQWLRWQGPDVAHPVFFRTKRASAKVLDDLLIDYPQRAVTIDLRAEPFAYGLPEAGTFMVANDPTAVTNPMSYTFPEIRGDVATPLHMKVDYSASDVLARSLIATTAATPAGVTAELVAFDAGTAVGSTSWTRSVVSDASAIGGSCVRFTRVGSTERLTTQVAVEGIERGDYKVLMRCRATMGTPVTIWPASIGVWVGIGDTVDVPAADTVVGSAVTTGWNWVVGDIARFPGGAPDLAAIPGTELNHPVKTPVAVKMYLNNPQGVSIDIDTILLVPAGLDRASGGTFLRALGSSELADTQAWLDGINDAAMLVADDGVGMMTELSGLSISGAMPVVTPGSDNTIFLAGYVDGAASDAPTTDAKANTFGVDYLYYPRYLYARPAST